MKPFRKTLAVIALSGASMAAWFGASSIFKDVQFARAAQDIEATRQQLGSVQDISAAYRAVAKVIDSSVVKIDVKKNVRTGGLNIDPDLLRRFFPDRDGDGEPDVPDEEQLQMGEGSGVIMEADGGTAYILTNNHVAGGATDIRVTLADGREVTNAKVVGADPKSDLAVVRISASNVIAAHWGNSDELQKGDVILAFGSPFGYVGSMTHGIVSALNRDRVGIIGSEFSYENFIQVDAPINPGNSGGPLVNLHGEVVGINTAIASRTGSFNGIGFAIPSSLAKPVYEQLKEKGKVVRGWLGVEIASVNDPRVEEMAKATGYTKQNGVLVTRVLNDTPSTGKLRPGDVITSINGKEVASATQLRTQIAQLPPDSDVKLDVFRGSKSQEVTLKIGEQPEDLLSRASQRNGTRGGGETGTASADNLGVKLATPNEQTLQRFGLESDKGAVITYVQPGSIAAQAGLRQGDLITRIGDTHVTNAKEATDALTSHDLSKGVPIYVTSKDGERFVFVKGK